MGFLDHVLAVPSYGWQDLQGNLIKPSITQIFREFFSRLNIFRNRKNWLSFFSWFRVLCLMPFLALFLFHFFHWWLLPVAFVYSMIIMGTHGTIWYHRYCTHRAYEFRNPFWRFITQNLTVNVVPEEIYVISHHVHHSKSDQPGDPYNVHAGFLYCFLADVNHQPIATDLDEPDYRRVKGLMSHTGITANTFAQYQRWGSYVNPWRTIINWLGNWAFWYLVFYLIGGHALACALFGAAGFWAMGVRTFNYEGHGKGKHVQREGTDYNHADMSVNQVWPGLVAGEWHNNHHLFPRSARSGFKPGQFDMAWYYIRFLKTIGAVSSYHDAKKQFYKEYYLPYRDGKISNDRTASPRKAQEKIP